MLRIVFFSIFLTWFYNQGCAQNKKIISGVVLDSADRPIPDALILISTYKKPDFVISHSVSDKQGHFVLSFVSDSSRFSLSVRCLGFKSFFDNLTIHNQTLSKTIRLKQEILVLNEVIVTNKPRLGQNDTTNYDLKSYSDGTEQNLEDVIKKIPGFKVSEDGSIQYKGVDINRIYVEGDDLTGKNYKRLSKNISPTLIQDVQAIERFVENKLLYGLANSDETVLNIKISEKRKSAFFGEFSGQIGSNSYHRASTNVFSYKKNNKTFLIGSKNNIGEIHDKEASMFNSRYENEINDFFRGFTSELFTQPNLTAGFFRKDLSNINNESLVGLTNVFRHKKKIKLLSDISIYDDQRSQMLIDESRFWLSNELSDNFVLSQFNQATKNAKSIRARNQIDWSMSDSSSLTFKSYLNRSEHQTFENLGIETSSKNFDLKEKIGQTFNSQILSFSNQLNYVKRVSRKVANQILIVHSYESLPQSLTLASDSRRFSEQFKIDSATGVKQRSVIESNKFLISDELFTSWKQITLSATLGVGYEENLIRNRVYPISQPVLLTGWDSLDFEFAFRQRYAFGKMKAEKSFNRFNLASTIGFNYLDISGKYKSPGFVFPNISLRLKYLLSNISTVTFSYDFDNSFSRSNDLIPKSIITDYRTIYAGAQNILRRGEHSISFLIVNLNNRNFTEYQIGGSYAYRPTDFGQIISINNLFNSSELFIGNQTFDATLYATFAKLIAPISTRIEFETINKYDYTYNFLNGAIKRNNNSLNLVQNVRIGTSFDFPINVFLGSSFSSNRFVIKPEGEMSLSVENSFVKSYFHVNVKSKISLYSFKADYLQIGQNNYFLFDFNWTCTPKKGKISYFINAKNLSNTQRFEQLTLTDRINSTSSFNLLPRMIMAGLSIKF